MSLVGGDVIPRGTDLLGGPGADDELVDKANPSLPRGNKGGRGRRHRIDELLAGCREELRRFELYTAQEAADAEVFSQQATHKVFTRVTSPAFPSAVSSANASARIVGTSNGEAQKAAASSSAPLQGHAASGELDRTQTADIALNLLQSLVQANTVLECNLSDYDAALCSTIREVFRLKADIAQMEAKCGVGRIRHLEDMICQEMRAHSRLKMENVALMDKNRELLSVIQEAMQSTADEETTALIWALLAENNSLRQLLGLPLDRLSEAVMAGNADLPRMSLTGD